MPANSVTNLPLLFIFVYTGKQVRRRRGSKIQHPVRPDRALQAQPDGGDVRDGRPPEAALQRDADHRRRHRRPGRAAAAGKWKPLLRQGWLLGGIRISTAAGVPAYVFPAGGPTEREPGQE